MARAVATFPQALPTIRFRDATGAVEFAIVAAMREATRPAKVTAILTAAIAEIAGHGATPALIASLACGTREWLLQQVAAAFRPADDWYESECAACGTTYDLGFDLAGLPCRPAGPGFPVAEVETGLGRRRFEVPNGADEDAVAAAGLTGRQAFTLLLARCGLDSSAENDAARFDAADVARIDAALEAVAPEPPDAVTCRCPSCGEETRAAIDPIRFAFPPQPRLLHDIHLIAAAYHWSEPDILALPEDRRQIYLRLIRAERPSRSRS